MTLTNAVPSTGKRISQGPPCVDPDLATFTDNLVGVYRALF